MKTAVTKLINEVKPEIGLTHESWADFFADCLQEERWQRLNDFVDGYYQATQQFTKTELLKMFEDKFK